MPANPNEYTEKSAKLLRAFHRRLTRNGINSHLRFSVDGNTRNHIHIDAVRIKTSIDVTVTTDLQLELALPNQRCRTAPDTAIDLIVAFARKGSA